VLYGAKNLLTRLPSANAMCPRKRKPDRGWSSDRTKGAIRGDHRLWARRGVDVVDHVARLRQRAPGAVVMKTETGEDFLSQVHGLTAHGSRLTALISIPGRRRLSQAQAPAPQVRIMHQMTQGKGASILVFGQHRSLLFGKQSLQMNSWLRSVQD
jgi:hypothetical protein